jgi:3-hydroxyacyl-[acyl-carrier-protein] dehydratase
MNVSLGREEIEQIIPHRPPFLLLDEVVELVPGERVAAKRTVTEEDCAGHFPGCPIMPGVKMVEALAQCGAVAVLSQPENEGRLALFGGIDDIRFKRLVKPGETLDLLCEVVSVRGPVGKGKVKATVGGELAVRGTLTFAVAGGVGSTEPRAAL